MNITTEKIIRAATSADATISPEMVIEALSILNGVRPTALVAPAPLPRMLSRKKVAEMTGLSKARVDNYCREGVFKRVTLRGSKRANGILESSVVEAINSGAACG